MIKKRKFALCLFVVLLAIANPGYCQQQEADSLTAVVSMTIDSETSEQFTTDQSDDLENTSNLGKFLVLVTLAIFLIILINISISKRSLAAELRVLKTKLKHIIAENKVSVLQNQDLKDEVKALLKKQMDLERKSSLAYSLLRNIRQKEILSIPNFIGDSKRDIYLNLVVQNAIITEELEENKYSINLEKLSLDKVANDLIMYLQALNDKNKIELVVKQEENYSIVADLQLLQLVILNLLMNVIVHAESRSKIQIIIENSDSGSIILRVVDSGMGIPKKHLMSIFQKYFHLTKVTPRSETHGLGLYTSSLAMQLMQGSIEVESKVGEGSKFSVKFPLTNSNSL